MTAKASLSNRFKPTARKVLRAQPIILPEDLEDHYRTQLQDVRYLLRYAGMTEAQLNDPNGLAFPQWGNPFIHIHYFSYITFLIFR